ncbi:MAG: hypothetical protein JSV68_23965 [Anaerolineaceae bacterium]|nr:MAG: hypothetical protein JSV68_23965 [Anaerolineaceae bacterium]
MKKGSQPFSYFEILDACKEPDCPVCTLGHVSANRHLTSLIFDGVNDVRLRNTLRKSLGYCHEHAWLLPDAGESATLGIAIIHRDLLNTIRRRLDESDFGKSSRRDKLKSVVAEAIRLDDATIPMGSTKYLPTKAQCPACERRDEAENLALKSLIDALEDQDEQMAEALKMSDGLCLSHLRQTLESMRSHQAFDKLVKITQDQLSALILELDEFIRKSDHRFRHEKISDSERESWRRALQRVVGPKTGI